MGYEGEANVGAEPEPVGEPKKYEWFQDPEVVYQDEDTVRLYYPDVNKYMSVTFDFPSNEEHTKFLESKRSSADFMRYNGFIFYHTPYEKELAENKRPNEDVANRNVGEMTNDEDLEQALGLPIKRIRRGTRLAKELFFKGNYVPGIRDGIQETIDDIERVLAEPPPSEPKEEVPTPEPIRFVPPQVESPYLPKEESDESKKNEFGPGNWPQF